MQYLSAITTQASGSAGGLTASHNQYKRYLRARTIPVDPATAPQLRMRRRFATISQWWQRLLSQSQRDAWDLYAANVLMSNALGDDCHWTGRHHFFAANLAVEFARPPALARLPGPTTFNRSHNAAPSFTRLVFPPLIMMHFDTTDAWVHEQQGFLIVYVSRLLTTTVNFFKGPYSYAMHLHGDPIAPPTSPTPVMNPGLFTPLSRWYFRTISTRADGRVAPATTARLDAVP